MKKEIEELVNTTDFNKHQLVVSRTYKEEYVKQLEKENQELKEEINKISKKELKVRDMLYSIEYGTLTRERLNQIEEVLFELGE